MGLQTKTKQLFKKGVSLLATLAMLASNLPLLQFGTLLPTASAQCYDFGGAGYIASANQFNTYYSNISYQVDSTGVHISFDLSNIQYAYDIGIELYSTAEVTQATTPTWYEVSTEVARFLKADINSGTNTIHIPTPQKQFEGTYTYGGTTYTKTVPTIGIKLKYYGSCPTHVSQFILPAQKYIARYHNEHKSLEETQLEFSVTSSSSYNVSTTILNAHNPLSMVPLYERIWDSNFIAPYLKQTHNNTTKRRIQGDSGMNYYLPTYGNTYACHLDSYTNMNRNSSEPDTVTVFFTQDSSSSLATFPYTHYRLKNSDGEVSQMYVLPTPSLLFGFRTFDIKAPKGFTQVEFYRASHEYSKDSTLYTCQMDQTMVSANLPAYPTNSAQNISSVSVTVSDRSHYIQNDPNPTVASGQYAQPTYTNRVVINEGYIDVNPTGTLPTASSGNILPILFTNAVTGVTSFAKEWTSAPSTTFQLTHVYPSYMPRNVYFGEPFALTHQGETGTFSLGGVESNSVTIPELGKTRYVNNFVNENIYTNLGTSVADFPFKAIDNRLLFYTEESYYDYNLSQTIVGVNEGYTRARAGNKAYYVATDTIKSMKCQGPTCASTSCIAASRYTKYADPVVTGYYSDWSGSRTTYGYSTTTYGDNPLIIDDSVVQPHTDGFFLTFYADKSCNNSMGQVAFGFPFGVQATDTISDRTVPPVPPLLSIESNQISITPTVGSTWNVQPGYTPVATITVDFLGHSASESSECQIDRGDGNYIDVACNDAGNTFTLQGGIGENTIQVRYTNNGTVYEGSTTITYDPVEGDPEPDLTIANIPGVLNTAGTAKYLKEALSAHDILFECLDDTACAKLSYYIGADSSDCSAIYSNSPEQFTTIDQATCDFTSNSCAIPTDISGPTYFCAYGADMAGNTNITASYPMVDLDTNGPGFTVIPYLHRVGSTDPLGLGQLGKLYTKEGTIELTFAATDSKSGLFSDARIQVSASSDDFFTIENGIETTRSISLPSEGEYTITLTVSDRVTNETTRTFQVVRDTTPPADPAEAFSVNTLSNTLYQVNVPNLSFSADHDESRFVLIDQATGSAIDLGPYLASLPANIQYDNATNEVVIRSTAGDDQFSFQLENLPKSLEASVYTYIPQLTLIDSAENQQVVTRDAITFDVLSPEMSSIVSTNEGSGTLEDPYRIGSTRLLDLNTVITEVSTHPDGASLPVTLSAQDESGNPLLVHSGSNICNTVDTANTCSINVVFEVTEGYTGTITVVATDDSDNASIPQVLSISQESSTPDPTSGAADITISPAYNASETYQMNVNNVASDQWSALDAEVAYTTTSNTTANITTTLTKQADNSYQAIFTMANIAEGSSSITVTLVNEFSNRSEPFNVAYSHDISAPDITALTYSWDASGLTLGWDSMTDLQPTLDVIYSVDGNNQTPVTMTFSDTAAANTFGPNAGSLLLANTANATQVDITIQDRSQTLTDLSPNQQHVAITNRPFSLGHRLDHTSDTHDLVFEYTPTSVFDLNDISAQQVELTMSGPSGTSTETVTLSSEVTELMAIALPQSGTYSLTASYTTSDGTPVSLSYTTTIADTVPPQAEIGFIKTDDITQVGETFYAKTSDPTFAIIVTPELSNFDYDANGSIDADIFLDEIQLTQHTFTSSASTFTLPMNLTEGEHQVRAVFTDNASNIVELQATVVIDTNVETPSIQVLDSNNNPVTIRDNLDPMVLLTKTLENNMVSLEIPTSELGEITLDGSFSLVSTESIDDTTTRLLYRIDSLPASIAPTITDRANNSMIYYYSDVDLDQSAPSVNNGPISFNSGYPTNSIPLSASISDRTAIMYEIHYSDGTIESMPFVGNSITLPDGQNTFKLRFIDELNNSTDLITNADGSDFTVLVDKTKPTALYTFGPNPTNQTFGNISIHSIADISPEVMMTITVNGATTVEESILQADYSNPGSFSFMLDQDQQNHVVVSLSDGINAPSIIETTIVQDATLPEVWVETLAGDALPEFSPTASYNSYQITCFDPMLSDSTNGSGCNELTVEHAISNISTIACSERLDSDYMTGVLPELTQNSSICARVSDKAGNIGYSDIVTLYFDTNSPEFTTLDIIQGATSINPRSGVYYLTSKGDLDVTFGFNDDLMSTFEDEALSSCAVYVDDVLVLENDAACQTTALASNRMFTLDITALSEGSHSMKIVIADRSEKTSEQTYQLYLDTNAPALSINGLEQSSQNYSTTALTGVTASCSDAHSGCRTDGLAYLIAPEVSTTCDDVTLADQYVTCPSSSNCTLPDFTQVVEVCLRAQDEAGNSTYSDIYHVGVDLADPIISNLTLESSNGTITPTAAQYYTNTNNVTLNFTPIEDETGIASCTVNGIAIACNSREAVTYNLPPLSIGDQSITLTVQDLAGNTRVRVLDVTFDEEAPTVSGDLVAQAIEAGRQILLMLPSAYDNASGSGMKHFELTITANGETATDIDLSQVILSEEFSISGGFGIFAINPNSDGALPSIVRFENLTDRDTLGQITYDISLKAVDFANNKTEANGISTSAITFDTSAPVVTKQVSTVRGNGLPTTPYLVGASLELPLTISVFEANNNSTGVDSTPVRVYTTDAPEGVSIAGENNILCSLLSATSTCTNTISVVIPDGFNSSIPLHLNDAGENVSDTMTLSVKQNSDAPTWGANATIEAISADGSSVLTEGAPFLSESYILRVSELINNDDEEALYAHITYTDINGEVRQLVVPTVKIGEQQYTINVTLTDLASGTSSLSLRFEDAYGNLMPEESSKTYTVNHDISAPKINGFSYTFTNDSANVTFDSITDSSFPVQVQVEVSNDGTTWTPREDVTFGPFATAQEANNFSGTINNLAAGYQARLTFSDAVFGYRADQTGFELRGTAETHYVTRDILLSVSIDRANEALIVSYIPQNGSADLSSYTVSYSAPQGRTGSFDTVTTFAPEGAVIGTIPSSLQGTYTFTANLQKTDGSSLEAVRTFDLVEDILSPRVTFSIPTSNEVTYNEITNTYYFNSSETALPLSYLFSPQFGSIYDESLPVHLEVRGASFASDIDLTSITGETASGTIMAELAQDGVYQLTISASDNSPAHNEVSSGFRVLKDQSAPTLRVSARDTSGVLTQTGSTLSEQNVLQTTAQTITMLTEVDNEIDPVSIVMTQNGTEQTSRTAIETLLGSPFTQGYTYSIDLPENTLQTFNVLAVDNAGQPANMSLAIRNDTLPPEVTGTVSVANSRNNSQMVALSSSLRVTDYSTVYATVIIDGVEQEPVVFSNNAISLNEGTYTNLQIVFSDALGNKTSAYNLMPEGAENIVVDFVSPEFQVSMSPEGPTTLETEATLTVQNILETTATSIIRILRNGNTEVDTTIESNQYGSGSGFTLPLDENAVNTFEVYVIDEASNSEDATVLTLTNDQIGPKVLSVNPAWQPITKRIVWGLMVIDELGSDIAEIQTRVLNKTTGELSGSSILGLENNPIFSVETDVMQTGQRYQLEITAVDSLGNDSISLSQVYSVPQSEADRFNPLATGPEIPETISGTSMTVTISNGDDINIVAENLPIGDTLVLGNVLEQGVNTITGQPLEKLPVGNYSITIQDNLGNLVQINPYRIEGYYSDRDGDLNGDGEAAGISDHKMFQLAKLAGIYDSEEMQPIATQIAAAITMKMFEDYLGFLQQ